MRAALAFAFVLALAVPGLAEGEERPGTRERMAQAPPAPAATPRAAPAPAPARPPPASAPGARPAQPPAPAPGAHGVRPAPAPGPGGRPTYYYPRRAYPYRYYPYGYYGYPMYAAPLWWGWDWGWGYYPLYPRPPYPYRDEPIHRVTTTLALAGGPTRERLYTRGDNGATGSLSLSVEGERLGFHGNISGFTLGNAYRTDSTSAVGIGTAHLTYALVAGDAWRLRLEMGASMLSWPDSAYAQGALSFGPDVGLSGNLGLVGPLGIQAHGRVTPYPHEVVDAGAALAVRLGPVAVTGGWRHLFVDGGPDLASFRFDGPELGVAFLF